MPNWCNNNITIRAPKKKLDKIVKAAKKGELLNHFLPMPKELDGTTADGSKDKAMIKKTGYSDWYSWAVDNWGTKWITPTPIDEVHETELINLSNDKESLAIEFANQSAWAPPYELISYICKTYNLRGSCRWHEEGGNADWGHFDNKGELVS